MRLRFLALVPSFALACSGSEAPVDTPADVPAADVVDVPATPDGAPMDVAPDVRPDVAPMDTTPQDAADAAADVAHDVAPDVAPDVVDVPPVDVDTRCTSDMSCASSADGPLCDTTSGRCVACTTASDRCPSGQYCVGDTHRCADGCRDDAACSGATARCEPVTHRCVACATDAHCGAGMLCVGNVCVAGCNATHPCATGQTCCSNACVDTQLSTAHCGACDAACTVSNGAPACTAGACSVASCTAPFGNCDGSATNGCETDTRVTAAHCGACGMACAARANANATCADSACTYRCQEGFGDCDGNAANGCETDIRVSETNCGSCGTVCPRLNNVPQCAAGACTFSICAGGYGNCDGMAGNGCETNVTNTLTHCGTCGNVCPTTAHSTPTCAASACGVTCDANFAECNGVATDGCETDTRTTVAHCGGCGRACSLPNVATPTCVSSACAVGACAANFGDCDATASNGCETDTRTSVAHCGACGHACAAGQPCSAGACQTLTTCAAIHASFPSAPSGVYTVDADGAGALPALAVYCDMTTDGGGWMMLYKLSAGVAGEPSRLWFGGAVNDTDATLLTVSPSPAHYVSRYLALWNAGLSVTQSRLAVYTAGTESAFLRFNSTGTNRTNWFTRANVAASTWTDLATEGQNFFQVEGLGNYGRHFFINRNYGGCPADVGWLVVNGSTETTCDWSLRVPYVSIMYSRGTTLHNWNEYTNIGLADVLAVMVR